LMVGMKPWVRRIGGSIHVFTCRVIAVRRGP
jgi:hypothetical protein